MKPGIYKDLSNEDYHALKAVDVISSSSLKVAQKSLSKYKALFEQPASEPTEAMILGTLLHGMVLENQIHLPDGYAMKPTDMKFSTKEGKSWREENKDSIIVSEEGFEKVKGMAMALASNNDARKALKVKGEAEVSLIAQTEILGQVLTLTARPDFLPDAGNIIWDIKTTQDADPQQFVRTVCNFGYDKQAAFYLKVANLLGIDKTQFGFICVESSPPYDTSVCYLDTDWLVWASVQNDVALKQIAIAVAQNEWPGYPSGLHKLDMPQWERKQFEANLLKE